MENIALVGLSRQVSLRRQLDVIANNMANLNTTGFKADDLVFEEYLMPTAREDNFQRGADRRLSFVWDRGTAVNMAQGDMNPTGSALDVAIGGRGFFAVQTPNGERYTRGGAFEINAQNELVTKQGHAVLGEGGPIRFEPGDTNVAIARDGTVSTARGVRGRIRVAEVENQAALEKQGENLFRLRPGAQATTIATPDLRQGYLEKANVRPIVELSQMIEVNRAYQSISSMLERHDQLRRESIRTLGEVPR